MPKRTTSRSRGSIIGAVGGVLIGAAILLFVAIQVLTSLKDAMPTDTVQQRLDANITNATVDSLMAFLTICVILLGVLGITMVGSTIISYISAGFG